MTCRCTLRDSFQDFLKEAAAQSEGVPTTLDQLTDAGVRLVISDRQDPDEVGFVQWRCAFYVAGQPGKAVQNFMCLFDDFIVWKTTQLQKDVEVHVYQHHRAELTRTFCDELTYQHYHFNPATDEALPLKWQVGRARARTLVKL